jgi:hypothetical protein
MKRSGIKRFRNPTVRIRARSGYKFTPHRQCRFVRLIAEGHVEEFARVQRAGVSFERFVGASEMLNWCPENNNPT